MKFYRIKLASSKIARCKPVESDCDQHKRRNYLLRINSTERVRRQDGTVEEQRVSTFGAALHYAAVFVDGRPMAFAHVERVRSAKDRRARFGYASRKFGIECILGLGGTRYYVPVGALVEVVSTIEREGVHYVLFSREPFLRGSRALGLCATATLEEYIWYDINIAILQPATMQKVGTSLAGTIVSSIVLGHARHSIRLSDETTKDIDTLPAIRVRQCGYHSISAQSQDEVASPPQNLEIMAEDAPNRLTSGGSEWRTRREASKRVGAA